VFATLLRSDPEVEIVGECSTGTEAIESIRSKRPSLVFLDVQMPDCDGFDVIEHLGSDAPKAVVFVTAYGQYALKAFEVEALDYLLKPFDDVRDRLDRGRRLLCKLARRGPDAPVAPQYERSRTGAGSEDLLPGSPIGHRKCGASARVEAGFKWRV
jgi:DNA-binding LytR/AlgR family response regulator